MKPDANGDIWFTNPTGNKIGKVDGKTMKVTQWTFPLPRCLPARMEIAPDGMIWVGEFNARQDGPVRSQDANVQGIPAARARSDSLRMGFDADGYIWYNSHDQDKLGRFDTKTGKVIEYPFPHSEIAMREFFRDSQGRMWYGTNPNNKVGYFYLANAGGPSSVKN